MANKGTVPLSKYAETINEKTSSNKAVAEYWSKGRGWRKGDFENILPRTIIDRLEYVHLQEEKHINDETYWGMEASEEFTVK